MSSRTTSRARSGARLPLTVNTGADEEKAGASAIETLPGGAAARLAFIFCQFAVAFPLLPDRRTRAARTRGHPAGAGRPVDFHLRGHLADMQAHDAAPQPQPDAHPAPEDAAAAEPGGAALSASQPGTLGSLVCGG